MPTEPITAAPAEVAEVERKDEDTPMPSFKIDCCPDSPFEQVEEVEKSTSWSMAIVTRTNPSLPHMLTQTRVSLRMSSSSHTVRGPIDASFWLSPLLQRLRPSPPLL